MGAGGAADDGVEEEAAVTPAVAQAYDQVGGVLGDAMEGLPDAAQRVGVDMFGGGVE